MIYKAILLIMLKRSGIIINIFLLLSVLLGGYLTLGVKVEENAMDLLPGEALRGDMELLQHLGMLNQVFLSLECDQPPGSGGGAPPELLKSAQAIGTALAASPLFREVFYRLPDGYEFRLAGSLQRYLPLLVDPADLAAVEARLAPAALDSRLHQSFLTLNNPAGLLMAKIVRNDPLDLTGVLLGKLAKLRGRLRLNVQDGYFVSQDGRHCLLWAESVTSLIASAPAKAVKAELDQVLAKSLEKGVRARLIGPLPHSLANSETIQKDLARLLPLSMVVLVLILVLLMRSWVSLLLVSMPFLAAPPAVAALSLLFPQPSAMALGFGIVLLGIGVDYAIYMYLVCRVEEGRVVLAPPFVKSLLMAAFTTIGVFVVLLYSHVPVHRQMAALAIVGLVFSLLLAWQLVPLLVARRRSRVGTDSPRFLIAIPTGRGWTMLVLLLWLLLLVGGMVGWSRLHYNGDLKSLDAATTQVREDEREFRVTWGREGEQAFVVAGGVSPGAALDLNDQVYSRLARADQLDGVQSLAPVLPGPARQARNAQAWQNFWQTRLPAFRPELEKAAQAQGFAPRAFQPFLERVVAEPPRLAPEVLIDGPLHPFLASLYRQVPVAGGEGRFLATTLVPENSETAPVLGSMSAALPGVRVLSNSRWRQQIDVLIKDDIFRLTAFAALVVILICLVAFREPRTLLGALAPVLSAQAAMALYAWLTGGELNMMHLLMAIMVQGPSVDYGIFMVTACREGMSRDTLLAVSLCALSTLSGFGVLALAVHPALRALGMTVLIGIGAAWPTAILVSPVIAGVREKKPC